MFSKITLIKHSNNVMLVIWIFLHNIIQILCFFMSKLMVHFCVSCNFQSYNRFIFLFMVFALDYLRKWAFTENLHDFIPIWNMFTNLNSKISFKVIKHGVTLIFSILVIFCWFLLFIKSLFSFFIYRLKNIKVISMTISNGSSKINCLKLIWTLT